MSTYFGAVNSDGTTPITGHSNSYNNDNTMIFWDSYVCPGSGTQNVDEIAIDCAATGLGDVTMRLAIYDSAGTTLIQQSSTLTILSADTTDSWRIATMAATTLTGGTTYKLAGTVSSSVFQSTHNDNTGAAIGNFVLTDYTGGFPASLPGSPSQFSAGAGMYTMRVGVSAAGGGPSSVTQYFISSGSRWGR